ncbi:MAG: hypothetical protein ACK47B_10065 [Armatimonadota bacterium]
MPFRARIAVWMLALATWPVNGALADTTGEQLAAPPAAQAQPETESVLFPETGVRLERPEGFEKAKQWSGFGQPATRSAVMITRIPGPFAEVTAGFTAERLAQQGIRLASKAERKVGDLPGVLLELSQRAGGEEFSRWVLMFGDEQKTLIVSASFPVAQAEKLSAPLKASVLSAKLEGEPTADGAAFTLSPAPGLKPVPGLGTTLLFNRTGTLQAAAPTDPLFVAAESLGKVSIDDRRAYAVARLEQTAQTDKLKIRSTKPIQIEGMDGFESVAEAKDPKSGASVFLYQVMLFRDGGYLLMQGIAGTKHRKELLPQFQEMARSLKLKPEPR